jgi:signal transduction histidine kinase
VLVVVVAVLFGLVFAHAVASFVRGHDPLAGEVLTLFGAMLALFALALGGALVDPLPRVVFTVLAALVLAVPLLTLRLVSRFRRLPRWVLPAAAMAYVVSLLPYLVRGADAGDVASWLALVVFAATELTAAWYFMVEARDRVGAARLRLYVAGTATALFAAALLSTRFGVAGLPQALALFSGLGYVAAFMPPRPIRAMSAMAAAHMYSRQLLSGPTQPTAREVWRRFAVAAHELTESDAVVVLARTSNGQTGVDASAGIDLGGEPLQETVEFERLMQPPRPRRVDDGCPLERALAAAVGARFATMVPVRPPYQGGVTDHVALLLSAHRSLFSGDDLEVIRDLGAQATLLAGRAEAAYEQRRLANELGETVEALHVASQAKSDLLARVSHEFRTPLTAIIGYSALLRRSIEGGDPMLALTGPDRIHSAGLHLLALVEEVLDLAQMDAGHLDLHVREVDLSQLAARTIDELSPLAGRKRLSVRSEVPEGTIPVDPNRMRQVLYNLLSNAIKFTPAGGRVRVEAELNDDKVRISVVDNGLGIPEDDQPRIFEEFTQVTEHGPHEGSGLGLAIVRRLVAAHGGHTELESTPGEGSRFIITLPRRHADVPTGDPSAP